MQVGADESLPLQFASLTEVEQITDLLPGNPHEIAFFKHNHISRAQLPFQIVEIVAKFLDLL